MNFARQMKLSLAFFSECVTGMVRLRELKMAVDESEFSKIRHKYPWEHDFTEKELEQLEITKLLGQMKQLKTLTLSPEYCTYANTNQKKEIFAANVKALEALINRQIDSAKPIAISNERATQSTSECVQLYLRSKVCFGCSEIHHGIGKTGRSKEASKQDQEETGGSDVREDPMAWSRPKNLPNSKEEIRGLVEAHIDDFIEHLFAKRQKYREVTEGDQD